MRLGSRAIEVAGDFDNNAGTLDTTKEIRVCLLSPGHYRPGETSRELLWRFAGPESPSHLGFTTSYPAIMHFQGSTGASPLLKDGILVVGSGPDDDVPANPRGYDGFAKAIPPGILPPISMSLTS